MQNLDLMDQMCYPTCYFSNKSHVLLIFAKLNIAYKKFIFVSPIASNNTD